MPYTPNDLARDRAVIDKANNARGTQILEAPTDVVGWWHTARTSWPAALDALEAAWAERDRLKILTLHDGEEIERLKQALEYKPGACRMLSQGDACDCTLCKQSREIERLRAWIARTADDASLNRNAGYHGRRVKLEAMAILCGKDVPCKAAKAAGGEK